MSVFICDTMQTILQIVECDTMQTILQIVDKTRGLNVSNYVSFCGLQWNLLRVWKYLFILISPIYFDTVVFTEGWIEGIPPKGPYLPCESMAGRALLAGYRRNKNTAIRTTVCKLWQTFRFSEDYVRYWRGRRGIFTGSIFMILWWITFSRFLVTIAID